MFRLRNFNPPQVRYDGWHQTLVNSGLRLRDAHYCFWSRPPPTLRTLCYVYCVPPRSIME